ncbi:MAG: hypothetical protein CL573_08150 [Alphaproteobacteria bacterium]|nr:hypothetical protein [Alphaproteobacteria bacterium]HCP01706.1 hypothetical protein [Rhodospirillaceae bacterium]
MRIKLSLSVGIVILALASVSAPPAIGATENPVGPPGFQADIEGAPFESGQSAAGRFLAARHAHSVGNLVAAADLIAGVLAEVSSSEAMQRRAHLLMVGAGRFEEAASVADRLFGASPNDALIVYTLIVRALQRDDYARAVELLEGISGSGVNAIIALLLEAWSLAGQGRAAEGVAALDTMSQNVGLAQVVGFHQALIADFGGDIDGAELAFRRALDASDGRPSLQLVDAFARFLVRIERREEAAGLVNGFVNRNPQTLLIEPVKAVVEGRAAPDPHIGDVRLGVSKVFSNVASLHNRKHLPTEAMLFTRMALGLAPNNASARFSLAQLLEARDREDLAIETYEKIDANSPYRWYARLRIADAMHARGESEQALSLLRAMAAERPGRTDAARAMADLLRMTQRFEEAIDAYDLVIERLDGEPDWGLFYSRGISLERAKHWGRAERDFLKALELSPDQPLVLNYLGYSWVEQGVKLERAKGMIEIAVEKRPRDAYITDSLGWVLYRLGDYVTAVVHLETAVALEPGDPIINDHLGDAYWVVGRKLEARFQWLRALSLKPESDVEMQIRLKLNGKKMPEPMLPRKKRGI